MAEHREHLATYLHDHLAGAELAVELLNVLCRDHAGTPVGEYAAQQSIEVNADVQVLKNLIESVGGSGYALKEAAGWIAAKVSRVKLAHSGGDLFSTFEALEVLSTGILGKRGLWRALAMITEDVAALQKLDLDHLVKRADSQFASTESLRLQLALDVLR